MSVYCWGFIPYSHGLPFTGTLGDFGLFRPMNRPPTKSALSNGKTRMNSKGGHAFVSTIQST
jgi:hypothetical protein